MLASGSDDGIVRLWNIKSNELKTFPADTASFHRIPAHRIDAWIIVQEDTQSADNVNVCPIVGIGFSPKNQALISAFNNGTVHIRSLNDNELNIFKGFDVINAMSLSPNGEILALSEEENSIRLWSIDGTLLKTLELSSPITVAISAISYSPNGKMLAVACDWGKIVLLSVMEGNELYTFQAHTNEIIKSISFSPDSKMLASASCDGTVKLWSIGSNQSKTFHGHSGKVTSVSFSPDGQILASSSWDKTVKLWNLDGSELHTFQGHTTPVNVVAFSPHGQMLASASRDGKVILWNLQLDELLVHGCNWLRDYLKTNPNISESDRHLCDGIGTQQ
jgi:WD40 repeat protein